MILDKIYDFEYQDTWVITYENSQIKMSMKPTDPEIGPYEISVTGFNDIANALTTVTHKKYQNIFKDKDAASEYLHNLMKAGYHG